MTDEQIAIVIAEHLEPRAKRPPYGHEETGHPMPKYWEVVHHEKGGAYWWTWECTLSLTDPAMRDLLQAKLLEEGWIIEIYPYPTECVIEADHSTDGRSFTVHDTREHIWALAYIRAHNLTADRLEG